jgi:dTDP-4-dehydrorhamnose 3,5-epimerase-like enzyme
MFPEIIHFKPLGDARGSLVAIESDIQIPFPIRRVYYIFSTKEGVERGFHAHKDLQQIAIAVTGSCEIILDDGDEQKKCSSR